MEKIPVGSTVVYGIHGVCNVSAIEKKEFLGKFFDYYVLIPVYDTRSTVYVPCENEALVSKIKRIMSAEEIYELIKTMPKEENIWVERETERKKRYAEILRNGDRREIVGMIKALWNRREQQRQNKKKLRISDENFMRDAEKLLYEEFAYVLNITKEQVLPFICKQIEVTEK